MCRLRFLPLAFALLARGAAQVGAPNTLDGDGSTPLLWASYQDDVERAGILLRAGASVNAANDLGATPLWAACQNGSEAMVRKLLEAGANPNAALLRGETPLMMAARAGRPDIATMLLAKGANANAIAGRGQTALMWAVGQRHSSVVNILLAHGADVHARTDRWSQVMAVPPHGYLPYNMAVPHGDDTALLFAARVGDLPSAKLLVAAGANVNDMDAWGVSATVLAAHSGFADLVEFLLDRGANPNAARAGFTALHAAIMRRDERMVKLLLDHHADANAILRTWTPTRRSSRDLNFDPELVGASPFWLAARFIQPRAMRLLLEHGADPLFVHHTNRVSDGPFEHRTEMTNTLLAAFGLGGGKAWAEPARNEREALTLDAVKIAAESGVDLNATSYDGRQPIDAAKSLHYESVVRFLSSKGARIK